MTVPVYICDYIRHGGNHDEFLTRFEGATSDGFNPDLHLKELGVANQTTMLKSETEEIQRRISAAVSDRDGSSERFQVFDTICGATQERQDALIDMLRDPLDILLVVGGYNSSNTSHLVEMGQEQLPTFFIRDVSCLTSLEKIANYDLKKKEGNWVAMKSKIENVQKKTKTLMVINKIKFNMNLKSSEFTQRALSGG